MAGNNVTISTEEVSAIASQLEALNGKLTDELQNSKATVDRLANIWSGEASQATIAAYDEFAAKYFQSYQDIIAAYVSFLRTNVENGYFETERGNVNLSDSYK